MLLLIVYQVRNSIDSCGPSQVVFSAFTSARRSKIAADRVALGTVLIAIVPFAIWKCSCTYSCVHVHCTSAVHRVTYSCVHVNCTKYFFYAVHSVNIMDSMDRLDRKFQSWCEWFHLFFQETIWILPTTAPLGVVYFCSDITSVNTAVPRFNRRLLALGFGFGLGCVYVRTCLVPPGEGLDQIVRGAQTSAAALLNTITKRVGFSFVEQLWSYSRIESWRRDGGSVCNKTEVWNKDSKRDRSMNIRWKVQKGELVYANT